MRIIAAIAAVLVAAWLQLALLGHLRPLGVIPNVMLVVVVLYGLWSDATPAVAVAIGGGLLLDLGSGADFGLRMGVFAVVALALVAARQLGLAAESPITAVVAVALATILCDAVVLATIAASISGEVVSRIGRELIDNLVVLGLVAVVRLNWPRRHQTTTPTLKVPS